MKKTFSMLALIFLLAAVGGISRAENFKNQAGGISIWLPDDWEIDSDEQLGALYADAPQGDSFCVQQVLLAGNDLTAALKACRDPLAEEIDDFIASRDVRKDKLNGMDADFFRGEGQRDDKTWTVDVALIVARESVLLCAVGWEKGKEEKFAPLRDKIFASIKNLE
jgi:predicted Zn-dependent protease